MYVLLTYQKYAQYMIYVIYVRYLLIVLRCKPGPRPYVK